jgi:hypothetical protein
MVAVAQTEWRLEGEERSAYKFAPFF